MNSSQPEQQNGQDNSEKQSGTLTIADDPSNANVVHCPRQSNPDQQVERAEGAMNVTNEAQGKGSDEGAESKGPPVEEKKRCTKCGKKLGLIGGFPCRCGGTFCAVHRYSDRHNCNFNYREMGANEIRRDNPVVIAAKLRKL